MVHKKYHVTDVENIDKEQTSEDYISNDTLVRYCYSLPIDEADRRKIEKSKKQNGYAKQQIESLRYFIGANNLNSYTSYKKFMRDYTSRFLKANNNALKTVQNADLTKESDNTCLPVRHAKTTRLRGTLKRQFGKSILKTEEQLLHYGNVEPIGITRKIVKQRRIGGHH